VSYRQDNLNIYQEAVFIFDTGKSMIRPKLLRHLKAFARQRRPNCRRLFVLNISLAASVIENAGQRPAVPNRRPGRDALRARPAQCRVCPLGRWLGQTPSQ
jgi:hypothetical protein